MEQLGVVKPRKKSKPEVEGADSSGPQGGGTIGDDVGVVQWGGSGASGSGVDLDEQEAILRRLKWGSGGVGSSVDTDKQEAILRCLSSCTRLSKWGKVSAKGAGAGYQRKDSGQWQASGAKPLLLALWWSEQVGGGMPTPYLQLLIYRTLLVLANCSFSNAHLSVPKNMILLKQIHSCKMTQIGPWSSESNQPSFVGHLLLTQLGLNCGGESGTPLALVQHSLAGQGAHHIFLGHPEHLCTTLCQDQERGMCATQFWQQIKAKHACEELSSVSSFNALPSFEVQEGRMFGEDVLYTPRSRWLSKSWIQHKGSVIITTPAEYMLLSDTHLGPQLSSLWIIVVSQAKGELSGDSILARNEPASWSQFPGTPWLGGVLNKSPLPNDCLCPAHSGGEPQLDMGPYKHS
eukprot:1160006-Pelagomonas_calceolata.AAC.18